VVHRLPYDALERIVAAEGMSSTTPLLQQALQARHRQVQAWSSERLWGWESIVCVGSGGALFLGLGLLLLIARGDATAKAGGAGLALFGLLFCVAGGYCIRGNNRLTRDLSGVGMRARAHSAADLTGVVVM
jgi:hypothetical protein